MIRSRLVAALLSTAALPGLAQTVPVRGTGTFACGQYIEYRRTMERTHPQIIAITQWVWGYMSAYNLYRSQLFNSAIDPPDDVTILAYLEKFCRDHPLGTVLQGTRTLIEELGGNLSPPIPASRKK